MMRKSILLSIAIGIATFAILNAAVYLIAQYGAGISAGKPASEMSRSEDEITPSWPNDPFHGPDIAAYNAPKYPQEDDDRRRYIDSGELPEDNRSKVDFRSPSLEVEDVAITNQSRPAFANIEADKIIEYNKPHLVRLILGRDRENVYEFAKRSSKPSLMELLTKTSRRVQATLTASSAKVVSNSPETQNISNSSLNIWEWYVTPLSEDELSMTISLTQSIWIDGKEEQFPTDHFPYTFSVYYPWSSFVRSMGSNVWGGLNALIALLSASVTVLTFAITHWPRRKSTGSVSAPP